MEVVSTDQIQNERRGLPIYEYKQQIVGLIRDHLFCLITGETGSGKSTQLAQFVVDDLKTEDFKMFADEKLVAEYKYTQDDLEMAKKVRVRGEEAVRVVVT